MNAITVWREYQGTIELVGTISLVDGEICFAYDDFYEGEAISASLPVRRGPFSARTTACFFSALIPEGAARDEFAQMLHASEGEFSPYLERLNDESIGALLFSINGKEPYRNPSYERVEDGFLDELAARPIETAVSAMGKTRLSLSGAMAKVGLYQDGDSGRWFYPLGGAPSTHIIKAADGNRFPRETIMEALCLGAAGRCGFPAAECRLIDVDQGEPLLAIRRFDRAFGDSPRIVSTMPAPIRLHQEDFSQAASVPWKYEPTDGAYLPLISTIARRRCPNAFGEVNLLVSYTLFDYLIGNCDNHLRNYALLFDSTWNACEVAPIYDVASTVAYPSILLEMGVSFGGDRRIDHVTSDLLGKTIAACGLPAQLAFNTLSDLAENLPGAIEEEADNLSGQGFKEVRGIIKPLIDGVAARANLDH